MTNWEVFKSMFPQVYLTIDLNGQDVLATGNRRIDKDWWDEEYKEGEEDD